MAYSIKDIAQAYGYSSSTTRRHITKLKLEAKFKPSSLGVYFNDKDIKVLAELLGIDIKKFNK